jgi:hypothetical protein
MFHPKHAPLHRPTRLLPRIALLLVLGACSDATGPEAGRLRIDAEASAVQFQAFTTPGGRSLSCSFVIDARAQGRSGSIAAWGDATVRLHSLRDTVAVLTTVTVPASDVRAGWTTDSIRAGETRQGRWGFTLPVPGVLSVAMRYRTAGGKAADSTTFRARCGPPYPAGGVAPPAITDVRVEPRGEVESGRSVVVKYRVASPIDIWDVGVRVSGAFADTVSLTHRFSKDAENTASIPVPSGTALGQPVRLEIFARDWALQEHRIGPVDGPTAVDRTPPTISRVTLEPHLPLVDAPVRMVGQYAETDTLRLRVEGWDDHGLTHLVYSLGGAVSVRDSVAVRRGEYPQRITIPLRREWVGVTSLRLYARDASGLRSVEASSPADSFRVYPVTTRSYRSAERPGRLGDAVVSPDGRRLFWTVPDSNRVEVLSLESMTFEEPIRLSGRPWGVDVSPDGRRLAVALMLTRELALVDLARPAAAPERVKLDVLDAAQLLASVRYSSNGRLFVTSHHPDFRMVEYDPATRSQRLRSVPVSGATMAAADVVRTPDYSRTVFAPTDRCALLYVAATDRFSPCREATPPGTLSVSGSGALVAKGFGIFGSELEPLKLLPFEPFSTYVTGISPDGAHLWISNARGLIRARTADGRIEDRTSFPPVYRGRLLFAEGGRMLVSIGMYPDFDPTHVRVHTTAAQ